MEEDYPIFDIAPDTTITFFAHGKEVIRLNQNGDIYIKGNLCENDKEVVNGMRLFLEGLR